VSDLGNKEIISANIKRYMEEWNISRRELASKIGVSYTTLSSWIQGENYPRIDKIEKMANFFQINKSDLVERPKKENKVAETIAAHIDDDTPEAERQQIINFIENLKRARNDDDKF
jgi:transcriptional regulator with XRE-family HTH domain